MAVGCDCNFKYVSMVLGQAGAEDGQESLDRGNDMGLDALGKQPIQLGLNGLELLFHVCLQLVDGGQQVVAIPGKRGGGQLPESLLKLGGAVFLILNQGQIAGGIGYGVLVQQPGEFLLQGTEHGVWHQIGRDSVDNDCRVLCPARDQGLPQMGQPAVQLLLDTGKKLLWRAGIGKPPVFLHGLAMDLP